MSRVVAVLLAFLFAALVAVAVLLLASPPAAERRNQTTQAKDDPDLTERDSVGERESQPAETGVPQPVETEEPEPPSYTPPLVHTPALADFVNRESKKARVNGDIHVRLPKVEHPDDIKAVASVLLDTKDDDTVRHEAVNLLRRSNYPKLTEDLLTVLHNPEEKERFRSFVVQHLGEQAFDLQNERPLILGELHTCLSDRHTGVRREALLGLVRLDDPKGIETALTWFSEAKPETEGVQDLCVRVIRERDLCEHLPAIRKLIGGPNEDASRQAMVTVGQWGDQESRPLLEEAAKSTRTLVERAAVAALKKLEAAKTMSQTKSENAAPKVDTKGKTRF